MIYSRLNNPDLEILEDRLALWNNAESGLVFCSGMATIASTLLSFLSPGYLIVHSDPSTAAPSSLSITSCPALALGGSAS